MPEFPDWAAESDAPNPCPQGFYHWERATLLFVRSGTLRRSWPAPYAGDVTAGLQQVNEQQRRQLVGECFELRCRSHIYFATAEVDPLVRASSQPMPVREFHKIGNKFMPFAPRRLDYDAAAYLFAADAAALLLLEEIAPSNWPDVYAREPGSEAEPELAEDKSHWVRSLFGGQSNGTGFVLEHAFQKIVMDKQAQTAKRIADMMADFNRSVSIDAQRYNAERRRQELEAASRAITIAKPPPVSQVATESASASPSQVAVQRPQWHEDAEALLCKHGARARSEFVWDQLAAMEGYIGSSETLGTPGGFDITFKTLENKLSELRRKISKRGRRPNPEGSR